MESKDSLQSNQYAGAPTQYVWKGKSCDRCAHCCNRVIIRSQCSACFHSTHHQWLLNFTDPNSSVWPVLRKFMLTLRNNVLKRTHPLLPFIPPTMPLSTLVNEIHAWFDWMRMWKFYMCKEHIGDLLIGCPCFSHEPLYVSSCWDIFKALIPLAVLLSGSLNDIHNNDSANALQVLLVQKQNFSNWAKPPFKMQSDNLPLALDLHWVFAHPFYVIPAELSRFHFITLEFMSLLLTVCLLLWQLHPPSTTEPISNFQPNTSLAHPFASTCHSVTQAYCIECAIYI